MTSPPNNTGIPNGQLAPNDTWGDYNNIFFIVQNILNKMQTATIVKIVACTNSGGVTPVGFVDVLPMVNQIDGAGDATPHTTIYNIPYLRMQGGANAVILDPQPGDIGICVFASRDISKVKATKAQGNPGSYRNYSFADGMYLGGLLNGTPTQFVEFSAAGINVTSPLQITLTAPTVNINASTAVNVTTPTETISGVLNVQNANSSSTPCVINGNITTNADVIASGVSLTSHVHSGVTPGGGDTGAPV